jgi:LysR family glycine cleavage system transcriptional activator
MARRLVHLNAVRAFEAAARHLSFAKAAAELAVTPAAVSQQIKTLEEHLGTPLFRRTKRALYLTDAGRAMLPDVREGFDRIAAALARGRRGHARAQLVVSVTPSIAAKWLVPRLHRFAASHPDMDVRLHTTTRLVDFGREDVDLAVRYGAGHWPALEVTPLMQEEIFAVASPRLARGRPALRAPADLRHHTLVHDESMPVESEFPGWPGWLAAAGVDGVDPARGPHVDSSLLAIQAAIDGQGVALARSVLVADDIAAGRLVRLFEKSAPLRFGYYVVHPRRPPPSAATSAFKAWLVAEAAGARARSDRYGTIAPESKRRSG